MARSIWIDVGDTPRTAALHAHQIKRAYFPAWVKVGDKYVRDTRLTKQFLYGSGPSYRGGWKEAVGEVGVYYGASWIAGIAPVTLARMIDADLVAFGADNRQLAVDLNNEDHAFNLVAFMYEFRSLRPRRDIRWVVEGMQGGRLSREQLAVINSDVNLTVAGEAFYDAPGQSMLQYPADSVRCNLINYGVARGRADVCYDAAHLDTWWDGLAFTQNRLPA